MAETNGDRTRAQLIRAAARLMAEHGIEGVELNRIQREAGQRNRSAIAYHFVDRDGLVRAIGVHHRVPVNKARNRLLDRLERGGTVTIPSLVDIVVRPLAVSLDEREGRDYLIVLGEAASRLGTAGLYRAERTHTDSLLRTYQHLDSLLAGGPARRRRVIGQAVLVIPVLLADLAREVNRGALTEQQARSRVRDITAFVSNALLGSARPSTAGAPH